MNGARWTLLLALLLGMPTPAPAEDPAQTRAGLEQVRQRIDQTLANLAQKEEAETSLLAELADMDRQLTQVGHRLETLEAEVARLRLRENEARRELAQTEHQIHSLQGQVEKRLVALYKAGETGLLRVLFSRSRPSEMAWQYEYLSRVLGHDRQLLGQYRTEVQRRRTLLEDLQQVKGQRESALAEVAQQRDLLRDGQQARQGVLERARKDQHLLRRLLDTLEEQAGRLQALVVSLESPKSPAYTRPEPSAPGTRGQLPWPVAGRVLIGFGRQKQAELGTVFDHRGLELQVEPARPVAAVADGTVVFADRFSGYGPLVIVDHGNGLHSIYARLGGISRGRGEKVARGQVLGTTDGATGRFYFEIREQGTPVDPQGWLAPSP